MLQRNAKAIIAFFGPTITAFLAVVEESTRTHHPIMWPIVGVAALVNLWGAILVWAVPNKPE